MKPLEEQLRSLFRRVEPPAGFAGRVMARIAREHEGRKRRSAWNRPGGRWLRWAAAMAAMALLALGLALHQRQERRNLEAQKDSQEAMLALRITGQKLKAALDRAASTGQHLQDGRGKSDLSEEEP